MGKIDLKKVMSNPDVIKSIKMVNQMADYLSTKYNITTKEAKMLIERASEYNPYNKKEAYVIIDKLYRGELK